MKILSIENIYSVCRLSPEESIPSWVDKSNFYSITKTDDELSILCIQACVPENIKVESGWKILKVEGPLDFGLTGILSSILVPLSKAKISVFSISTFDTDYVLVKEDKVKAAQVVLEEAGFKF